MGSEMCIRDRLGRLTIFLTMYDNSGPPGSQTPEKMEEAVAEFDQIRKEYNSVLAQSLTLTTRAYRHADKLMRRRHRAANDGATAPSSEKP